MAKFTAAKFKKFGIKHLNDEDFSDDGNSFSVYETKNGIKFSYTKCRGIVYISAYDFYDYSLFAYDDVNNAGLYSLSDKFNGIPEELVNVEEIVKTFDELKEATSKATKKLQAEDISAEKEEVSSILRDEARRLSCITESLKLRMPWLELNSFEFDKLKDYFKSIELDICKISKYANDMNRHQLKTYKKMLDNQGFIEVDEDGSNWYVKEIKAIIDRKQHKQI